MADDERSGEARAIAERALGRLAVVTGGATVGRRGAPSRLPKNPPVCRAWGSARPRWSSSSGAPAGIVQDSLDRGFFAPAFELATDAEQRYLIAISSLGEGPYRTADAAAAAGYSSIAGACAVREEPIGKGLLWSPRRGLIDFTVPCFARYLRATHAPGP